MSRRGVPGVGWLLVVSLWLVPVAVGGPRWAWLGFLVAALWVRRRAMWPLVVVTGVLALALVDLKLDSVERGTWWGILLLVAIALHGFVLRSAWARLSGARFPAPGPPVASPGEPSAPAAVPTGPAPAWGTSGDAAPDTPPTGSWAPAQVQDVVDVNTATFDQLRALPGMTWSRAVAVRRARRLRHGFASLDELADAADLSPTESAALRHAAICSPPRHR